MRTSFNRLTLGVILSFLVFTTPSCDKLVEKDNKEESASQLINIEFDWVKKIDNDFLNSPNCVSDNSNNMILTVSFYKKMSIDKDTFYIAEKHADDIFIAKFDTKGNRLWEIIGGTELEYMCGGNVSGNDEVWDVKVDDKNNIYILGKICGHVLKFGDKTFGTDIFTSDANTNCFLMKLNPQGEIQWLKAFPYTAIFELTNKGEPIVTHNVEAGGNYFTYKSRIIKYNTGGDLIFRKDILFKNMYRDPTYHYPGSSWNQRVSRNRMGNTPQVKLGENNNIYINALATIYVKDTIMIGIDDKSILCFRDDLNKESKDIGFMAKLSENGDLTTFIKYENGVAEMYPSSTRKVFLIVEANNEFKFNDYSILSDANNNLAAYLVKYDSNFNTSESNKLYDSNDETSWSDLNIDYAGSNSYLYGWVNGLNTLGDQSITPERHYLFAEVDGLANVLWVETYPDIEYGIRNVNTAKNMPKYVFQRFEEPVRFNTGDEFTTDYEAGYFGKVIY